MKKIKNELINRIHLSIKLLEDHFGVPKQVVKGENLLFSLIHTILSQSTSDINCDRAYQELQLRFPTIELLAAASEEEISETIRSAGLYRQKSKRIKNILNWIQQEFGKLNIDEICAWPPEKVMKIFTSQKGIGVKTVAVLLTFKCGKDVFPVDTHVHRISKRLQLVPENATSETTFYNLDPFIPVGKSYSFHVNLLKLGRQICSARKPNCPVCPLKLICPSVTSFLNIKS
jgi:endonuclease III